MFLSSISHTPNLTNYTDCGPLLLPLLWAFLVGTFTMLLAAIKCIRSWLYSSLDDTSESCSYQHQSTFWHVAFHTVFWSAFCLSVKWLCGRNRSSHMCTTPHTPSQYILSFWCLNFFRYSTVGSCILIHKALYSGCPQADWNDGQVRNFDPFYLIFAQHNALIT